MTAPQSLHPAQQSRPAQAGAQEVRPAQAANPDASKTLVLLIALGGLVSGLALMLVVITLWGAAVRLGRN